MKQVSHFDLRSILIQYSDWPRNVCGRSAVPGNQRARGQGGRRSKHKGGSECRLRWLSCKKKVGGSHAASGGSGREKLS